MQRYATIEKRIGETPLEAAERLRVTLGLSADIPLAYAGRLDPMASGKLLVLIGDECKKQEQYHTLDKEYTFEVLFGVRSDTADVLGIVEECGVGSGAEVGAANLRAAASDLVGEITLPYPHFSAKTVRGKPLHVWTLEGRLDEIKIPTHTSHVYVCIHLNTRTLRGSELLAETLKKIDSFPTVTDERKALGRDFRRTGVRAAWNTLLKNRKEEYFTLATFRTISSSGTYMRSLAEELAKRVGTCGLAFGIHRTKMGTYRKLFGRVGLWTKQF